MENTPSLSVEKGPIDLVIPTQAEKQDELTNSQMHEESKNTVKAFLDDGLHPANFNFGNAKPPTPKKSKE